MHFMKIGFLPLSLGLFVSILFPTWAFSQIGNEGGPPQDVVNKQIQDIYLINLLYLPRSAEFQGKLDNGFSMFFRSDEEDFRINAIPGKMTKTIQYKGSRKMMFFKEPVLGPDGEMIREPLLNLNLSRPGRKLVFLTRTEQGVISGKVMDIDNQGFSENVVRIMNVSQQKVKAKVGESVDDIPAMGLKDFRVDYDKKRFLVPLLIAGHNGEDIYKIEDRKMAMTQGGRKMLLLFPRRNNPNELTYTQFTIQPPGFLFNSSDKKLKDARVDDNDRAYIRSGDR